MAYERDTSNLNRTDELRRNQMLDNELQPDPELAEGPASGGRMALFAIAVIAILAVVFYGLNNSSTGTNTAQNPPPATTSAPAPAQNAQNSPPSAMNPNTNPGQTTGSAPSPQTGTPSSESNNSAGTVTNGPTSSQTGTGDATK